MRGEKIIVENFTFINFLQVEGLKELNEHGSLKITGLISKDKEEEYLEMAGEELWVKVNLLLENGNRTQFFHGILVGMAVKREGMASILTLELKTGSFLLDIKKHTRSFQKENISFEEIIRTCVEEGGGKFVMEDGKKEGSKGFFLQYKETDWDFMKRLASYFQVPLIPEDRALGKKIYFGYRAEKNAMDIETDSISIIQDYGKYRKSQSLGVRGLTERDALSYCIGTRELYSLGDRVFIEGREYVVGRIKSWLKGQELYHEYHMVTTKAGLPKTAYNKELCGVSLKAKVKAVEKTMVQVEIEEDENKGNCKSRLFDYATVYSTPDGTGWYCMPEVGDEVRMAFPSEKEEEAYVASSVHLGSEGGRRNPENKSWKNKQKKEILLTPDSILLTNNKGMSIELIDEKGIQIVSSKDIEIESKGDIQIKSQKEGITMNAGKDMKMKQGASSIEIGENIYLNGGKIYMN